MGTEWRRTFGKALDWFAKAFAAAEDPETMRMLGDCRRQAFRDYAKARDQYEKPPLVVYAAAMNGIGLLYENGQGVPQDYAKAREWYEKAAAA